MTQEQVVLALKDIVGNVLAIDVTIDADAEWKREYSVDSVFMLEILLRVEDHFGVQIDEAKAAETTTLNQFAAIVLQLILLKPDA